MADAGERPIIIRRKVVRGGGHHGGAWKVAYADFVTAMMAFFLLMWLLNATTEEQRKGLADYFSPTIAIHETSGGGDGPHGGSSVTAELTMPQHGKGASAKYASANKQARGDSGLDDSAEFVRETTRLEGIAEALLAKGGESKVADELLRHVRSRVTDEGLIIEVHDLPGRPLFEADSARPTPAMTALMAMIGEVIALAENPVAVDNHLAQSFINRPARPGWELSSSRALAARTLIAGAGIDPGRFARVTGEADRKPAQDDATDLRNRRTEVVLLRMARVL
jgi:chemotaxis protein MotB